MQLAAALKRTLRIIWLLLLEILKDFSTQGRPRYFRPCGQERLDQARQTRDLVHNKCHAKGGISCLLAGHAQDVRVR